MSIYNTHNPYISNIHEALVCYFLRLERQDGRTMEAKETNGGITSETDDQDDVEVLNLIEKISNNKTKVR